MQLETLSIDFSCTPSLGFLALPVRRDAFIVPLDLRSAQKMEGVIVLQVYGDWDDRVLVEWVPEGRDYTRHATIGHALEYLSQHQVNSK